MIYMILSPCSQNGQNVADNVYAAGFHTLAGGI